MTARRRQSEGPSDGFTLVELLVAMIIIGVLAAIMVPVFLSQQQKAREATAKTDVTHIAQEVITYYVDGKGSLTLTADTAGTRWRLERGATVVATGFLTNRNTIGPGTSITSDTSYCVSVVPATAGASTWRRSQLGLAQGNC